MIETLKKHVTPDNEHLVEELIYVIEEGEITTMEELAELEDLNFTVNGKKLVGKERIEYAASLVVGAYWDYDGLTLASINLISSLKESYKTDKSDEEKIYDLIRLYDITERECLFLTEAYELVVTGRY